MWDEQVHLTAVATARPIRVAYLIDLGDCPPALLDSVFAECYGRWAGRRSLLVPADPGGIDPRYDEWLWYFDPDIIYSFVALTDDAVAALHERYAPAFLRLHQEPRIRRDDPPRFSIELPIDALSSISVLPTYAGRSRGFPGRPPKIEVLDKFWDRSTAPFVQENFGFLSSSLGNAANAARQHPELFTCTTLITKEALDNRSYAKDAHATYLTDENSILDRLDQDGGPLTMAVLSEFFAPYLNHGHDGDTA